MRIAIVGATGEVGRMMMQCLQEFGIPISDLALYASERSAGMELFYGDKAIKVQELKNSPLLQHRDYTLFSAGAGIARTFAPVAAEASELVIDNSSAFRFEDHIPLLVPEVNADLLQGYSGIAANPNCSTIQIIIPLATLNSLFGLKKLVVSTYQSVSGSGHKGVETLLAQRRGEDTKGIYPEYIDLNVIPQIGGFGDDGYSQEETKMHLESRKILRIPDLPVSATCVRVPVLYGHSVSVYAEFANPVDLEKAEEALADTESVQYFQNVYTCPRDLGSSNDSFVSRLRYGVDDRSLQFWCVGHNIRIGAAANAVRILKKHAQLSGKI